MLFVRRASGSGDMVAFAVASGAVVVLLRPSIAVQLIIGAVRTLVRAG